MKIKFVILLMVLNIFTIGCSHQKPIKPVDYVDIDRFMGKWYVIANIPTFIESGAFNAIESYKKNSDGKIETLFEFRKDGFDGETVQYHPIGTVVDPSNAIWDMQFIWPFQADYRIIYLDAEYQHTIIGRNKRDYVWIMSRQPKMGDELFHRLKKYIASTGYDVSQLQRVPQQW